MGTYTTERIIYIDTLRAFALMGILFVHVAQLYNFYNPAVDLGYYSSLDEHLRRGLLAVFEDRCRTIFCILFGSSFYLIMRKQSYTTLKFCWRCVLLMGFGLINIEFYNSDFMLCYGMVGIALALLPIRRMKTWMLFLLAGVLYGVQFVDALDYTAQVFPEANYLTRHTGDISLAGYLGHPYWKSLTENLRMFVPDLFTTLSFFVFGYALWRSGAIARIGSPETRGKRAVVCLLLAGVVCVALRVVVGTVGVGALKPVSTLSEALLYSLLFIFICKYLPRRAAGALASYGRLGLTNYSVQNICGPLAVIAIALPLKLPFYAVFCGAVVFYILQTVFAVVWLRRHKYGPWEWLWRWLTERCSSASSRS